MYNVICFGEVLWDNFKSGKKIGGAPLNVSLHLHKQGIKSSIISSVGSDPNGEELLDSLKKHNWDTSFLQQHPDLPTGTVEVELDENQQASYKIIKPVAWDEIQYETGMNEMVAAADAFVFGSLAGRSGTSMNTLQELLSHAKLLIFDMNLRPPHYDEVKIKKLMEKCDILKINEHELKYLEKLYKLQGLNDEDQLKQISNLTDTPTICVTLGEKGAMVLSKGLYYYHKGFPVKVADTVGAGDAFLASFIHSLLYNIPMDKALERACATGAFVASRDGANPEYYSTDIDKVIKGRG